MLDRNLADHAACVRETGGLTISTTMRVVSDVVWSRARDAVAFPRSAGGGLVERTVAAWRWLSGG